MRPGCSFKAATSSPDAEQHPVRRGKADRVEVLARFLVKTAHRGGLGRVLEQAAEKERVVTHEETARPRVLGGPAAVAVVVALVRVDEDGIERTKTDEARQHVKAGALMHGDLVREPRRRDVLASHARV